MDEGQSIEHALPRWIGCDRTQKFGRNASHPERQFIEWVDPEIGRRRDAELCQAHAFNISLQEWLSIEQEG